MVAEPKLLRILIQAIGNPSRGDDAVALHLLQTLRAKIGLEEGVEVYQSFDVDLGHEILIEMEWLFQLQIEQAEQWSRFDQVIVIDAQIGIPEPFLWRTLDVDSRLDQAALLMSHHLSPEAVAAINQNYFSQHPRVHVLGLQALRFELGEGLSPEAQTAVNLGLERLLNGLANHKRVRTPYPSDRCL